MSSVERVCQNKSCGKRFQARSADVKRGWARFCSKRCKAVEQERRTHQFAQLVSNGAGMDKWDREIASWSHPYESGYFGHGQE